MSPLPPWRRNLAMCCGVAALILSAILLIAGLAPSVGLPLDAIDVALLAVTFLAGRRRR